MRSCYDAQKWEAAAVVAVSSQEKLAAFHCIYKVVKETFHLENFLVSWVIL